MQFEKWFDVDLAQPRQFVPDLGFPVFVGDDNSVKIGVNLYKNKTAETVTGTVKGYCILPNGVMLTPWNGSKDGNTCWIALPDDALVLPGRIQVAIRLDDTNEDTVIFAASATVRRVDSDSLYDPDDIVPTWDDILEKIEDMDEAAEACATATENATNAEKYIASPEASTTASKAYAVGDYLIYNGKLYTVTTAIASGGTIITSGSGQNVTEIPGGLSAVCSDLKNAFDSFEDEIRDDYYDTSTGEHDYEITAERNSGYVDIYGTEQPNASYVYSQTIEVSEGDVITGTGTDTNYGVTTNLAMQKICAYANGSAVSASGVNSYVLTYTVPEGIDSIVISYLATMTDVTIKRHVSNYVSYTPKINDVENEIEQLITVSTKKTVTSITPTIVDGKFVNKSGTVSTNASYYYFEVSDLQQGDIVAVRSYYNNSASIVLPYFRYVCAYDGNGTAQSDKGAENVYGQFTVPEGITKIALSIQATYPVADGVLIYRNNDVCDIIVNDNLDSAVFATKPQTATGSISASGTLQLTANAVKKNKDIIFKGDITSFNQITIGQGTNDLNSSKIVIDETNITFFRGTSDTGDAKPHGLTSISTYLSVVISVDDDHLPTVTVMTLAGTHSEKFNSTWVGCMPNVYATADASTAFTNCTLSFVCRDIKEPLWIFGDSYVSFTSDRWTYYLSQMGYTGYLLNGYSGEDAQHAMQNLRNLLVYGTPKYIIWALGMNNPDTSSAVDAGWKAVYDELIALCNANNITPILCTIPNVTERDNSYKNTIVTASGYTYIDFATAVGASSDNEWYTGMLSDDGLHPTSLGAIALASEVLKDFPYACL